MKGLDVNQQYRGLNGEAMPKKDPMRVQYVLQRYRDVWVPIDTYPYLAIDIKRVEAHYQQVADFAVFTSSRLMQNLSPGEGSSRLLSGMMGSGVDAGLPSASKLILEGKANQQAQWAMSFNDPLGIGMHPFAALHTHYIYDAGGVLYQRKFADLVVVDGFSRPRSALVDFNPLAEMARSFHLEYISRPSDQPRDTVQLAALLDAMFLENERILAAATKHHCDRAPIEKSVDYVAPTLTRYGYLIHNASQQPRIALSFTLLHYEKALREFDALKTALAKKDIETAFVNGVYCVIAIAACAEAAGNRLVLLQTGAHPKSRDKRYPLEKINDAGLALAKVAGRAFVPLAQGHQIYDTLDVARKMRNRFMHATERDKEVDPVALTSIEFNDVEEHRCREYLRNLRLAFAHVFDQLAPEHPAPIVTSENVNWLGEEIEIP